MKRIRILIAGILETQHQIAESLFDYDVTVMTKMSEAERLIAENGIDLFAKAAADPWTNKLIPAGLLALALYTGLRNGAVLAGESAFALGYVAFNLYWKFQQENVIRKMEKGLYAKNRSDLADFTS